VLKHIDANIICFFYKAGEAYYISNRDNLIPNSKERAEKEEVIHR